MTAFKYPENLFFCPQAPIKPMGNRSSASAQCLGRPLLRSMSKFLVLLMLLAFGQGPFATAWAEEVGESGQLLTEEDALQIALEHRGFAAIWQAQRTESQAEVTIAGAWPNPVVGLSREQLFGDVGASEDTLSVEQSLILSGRLGLAADAARASLRAVEQEVLAQQSLTIHHVRVAFYDLLYRQQVVAIYERAAKKLEDSIEVFGQRVEAGESSRYELERLLRERADYAAVIGEETAALYRLSGELAARLGMGDLDISLTVAGSLLPEEIPGDEGIQRALSAHPEVLASEYRSDANALRLKSARRWWIPDLLVRGGLKRAGGDDQHLGFEAGLAMSVPLFYRGQGEVDRAQAQMARERALRSTGQDATRLRAIAKARAARHLVTLTEDYEVEAVERSHRLFELAQQSYRAGEMSLLEYLDAHQTLVNAELRYVELAANARTELVDLQRLLGIAQPTLED